MNAARVALYWAVAGLPLAWGVWHTVQNALKLFS